MSRGVGCRCRSRAQAFSNIYHKDSQQSSTTRVPSEKLAAEASSDRLLFGTDLPWFDPHHAIGVLMNAAISDEDRHNICHPECRTAAGGLAPDTVPARP